jgi:hypothetical protein
VERVRKAGEISQGIGNVSIEWLKGDKVVRTPEKPKGTSMRKS